MHQPYVWICDERQRRRRFRGMRIPSTMRIWERRNQNVRFDWNNDNNQFFNFMFFSFRSNRLLYLPQTVGIWRKFIGRRRRWMWSLLRSRGTEKEESSIAWRFGRWRWWPWWWWWWRWWCWTKWRLWWWQWKRCQQLIATINSKIW